MSLLAIDPGSTQSGFAIIDGDYTPKLVGKVPNEELLDLCGSAWFDHGVGWAVIEQLQSYGASVGRTVFDTAMWSGRFIQALREPFVGGSGYACEVYLLPRKDVKLNLVGKTACKDGHIAQALRDRFVRPGADRYEATAKGAFFEGFKADIWQAFSLGVTAIDLDPDEFTKKVTHVQ